MKDNLNSNNLQEAGKDIADMYITLTNVFTLLNTLFSEEKLLEKKAVETAELDEIEPLFNRAYELIKQGKFEDARQIYRQIEGKYRGLPTEFMEKKDMLKTDLIKLNKDLAVGMSEITEKQLKEKIDSTNAHLAECDYFLPRTSYYPEPGGNICCNDVSCNYYEGLYCETGNDICMGSASVDIMVSIGICNTYLPPTYPQGRNICCDGYNCQFSDQTECSDLQSHICVASVESFFLINPVCNSYLPDTPTGTNICCRERCAANLGEVCTGDTNCCDGYCSDYGLRTDYTKGPLPPEDWHCCPSGDAWFASDGICSQFAECYAPEPIVDVCNYNNTNETGYWTDPDCFRTLPPELSVPNQACCGVDWYGNLTFDYDDIYVYPWNYSG
ncbi:hypothetical protein HQ529_05935, partial [Candidatus Woesearchaeota archaeon]|nr:hypothetical protein [Candidatus Woesearchaeota archaeon]